MPSYRFLLMDTIEHGPLDLPDDAAAWREAKDFCGQMVRDELQPSARLALLVIGESGEQIFRIEVKAS